MTIGDYNLNYYEKICKVTSAGLGLIALAGAYTYIENAGARSFQDETKYKISQLEEGIANIIPTNTEIIPGSTQSEIIAKKTEIEKLRADLQNDKRSKDLENNGVLGVGIPSIIFLGKLSSEISKRRMLRYQKKAELATSKS